MPPQKKKVAKVQIKNQQKIAKAQEQIQATIFQNPNEDIEISHPDQIQYDNPIEDAIQNNVVPQSSPQKPSAPQENNNVKGRKRQAPITKAGQQEAVIEDAPLRQQPARTRRQLANKSNDSIATKKVNEPLRVDQYTSKVQNSTLTTRNAKKKENSDTKPKKNQTKVVIENSSQEDDIENNTQENEIKPEDLPLRQTRKNVQQTTTTQNQSKYLTTRNQSNTQAKVQQQQQLSKPQQNPPQQQQVITSKPTSTAAVVVNDQKPSNPVQNVNYSSDPSKENSGDKPSSGEKKKLTIREMEGLSKLLSIQVDGLKMKEQQMQNMIQNQNNNNGNNYRNNQNMTNNQVPNSQMNGPNPNYSINNLLNGLQPRKLIKPNNDIIQKHTIIQKNLSNLRTQLSDKNHIVIDEEYEDDIENQIDIEGTDQDIDIENIHEVVPTPSYPIQQQQRMNRSQVDQRVPLRSITPQNKTMSGAHALHMNQRPPHMQQQNVYGYQQNNHYQRKSVTPTGKMGIQASSNQNMGKITPLGNRPPAQGKITPMNQQIQNQIINPNTHMMNGTGKVTPINKMMQNNGKVTPINGMNGKVTPMNGMNGSGGGNGNYNGGKRTPIQYGNQQQQLSRFEIENEIQSRIETIKNNIGPLLACLNSDLIGGSNPQQQPQQQQIHQQDNKMDNNFLNRRIYQDMRERRIHAYDQQQQPQQIPPNQVQLQQQQIRGRSVTPTIQSNRRHFDVDTPQINSTYIPNNGQVMQRKVTPIRGLQQQQQQLQKQDIQQVPVGRNYDARAGDWLCGNCKNFNFAYRNICNRCGQLQDDNIHMVHPQITTEALDLIHELNHKGKIKTPIRTVDDVKRTFQDRHQNKENLKNISNTNGMSTNNQVQQQRFNNQKPYQGVQQDTNMQINRRQRITYKEFEEYENSLANNKSQNDSKQVLNDTTSAKNNINESKNKNEVVGNQIIFIDNSSAQPLSNNTSGSKEQKNDQSEKQNNLNNKQTKDETYNQTNNQRKRVVDPRVQLR